MRKLVFWLAITSVIVLGCSGTIVKYPRLFVLHLLHDAKLTDRPPDIEGFTDEEIREKIKNEK